MNAIKVEYLARSITAGQAIVQLLECGYCNSRNEASAIVKDWDLENWD